MKVLSINTASKKYNIYIGHNTIVQLNSIIKKEKITFYKSLIIVDKKVPKIFIRKINSQINSKKKIIYYFNSSEKNKNLNSINIILEKLFKNNFTRGDVIICVGGGIAGDVSAFAASIFKRGIKFINIPSTLCLIDHHRWKTGVNNKFGKNLVDLLSA